MTINRANSGLVLALVAAGFTLVAILELRDRARRRRAEAHDRSALAARNYRGYLK